MAEDLRTIHSRPFNMKLCALTAAVIAQNMRGVSALGTLELCGHEYSHTWMTKADMPQKRSDMTATAVGDRIYLVGGCAMDQTWVRGAYPGYRCGGGLASAITAKTTAYLPLDDRHLNLTDAPRGRYRHAAAEVDGKLYLFGGSDGNGLIVPEVDVYDIASDTWSTLLDSFMHSTTDNSAFAYDGKVYVIGGYDANWKAMKTTWVFDPTKTGAAAWVEGPEMQQGRGDFSAVLVGSSAIASGGFHEGNHFERPLETAERLDIGAGTMSWALQRSMSLARGDKAVAALNGALHVIGGEAKNMEGHSIPLRDVEVYHPDCDEWKSGGDIPSKRFRFTAAAHGQSLFIFGGQGYLTGTYASSESKYPLLSTVEEYSETVQKIHLAEDGAATLGTSGAAVALFAWALLA